MAKKYNFEENEKAMQEFWKEMNLYKFNENNEGPLYSIDTPPPTVSGQLHIGHIFSYAQAEMIARYKRMQGFNVFYPFGFDDNGLPTERLVEKEEKIRAKDLPRSEFVKKCLATTEKYEAQFRELWDSMGLSVDWTLQYETINPLVQKISQKSFLDLLAKGKAYQKKSPVLWCTECQTSIAQAEQESKEKTSLFTTLKFTFDEKALWIATTRPELLCACVALFVHPEDARFSDLHGKMARVPLYDLEIPILADDSVEMDKGTGAVMCATFGDATDLKWVQTHDLEIREVLTDSGHFKERIPYIGGLTIIKARAEILKMLAEADLIKEQKEILHTVSVHERCGTPIEILSSNQWYIDVLTDKKRYLEAADEINWYPPSMKKKYTTWVENLKWDWCISRQRYFGIPFPIWYCKSCSSVKMPEEHALPLNPLETLPSSPCTCGCNDFEPETAVLDTWATSSVTPQINKKWGEPDERSSDLSPMGLRAQAHEIIRTWAFYTIVKSLYHTGTLPWKDIMISGFVLAKKGEKISKSKNNGALSPRKLIESHSADAIRYWAAGAKLGTDTFFAEEDLLPSKRFLNKLWNASKFALMHLEDFQKESVDLMPIDKWIMARFNETQNAATSYLNTYELGLARQEIDTFFWNDLCDNYLELVKDRLYKPEIHGHLERRSAQFALYHVMLGILKLYAPYIPHMTEYIYQEGFASREEKPSIHLHQWEAFEIDFEASIAFGEAIKKLLFQVRKAKSEEGISIKTEIERIDFKIEPHLKNAFDISMKDLYACLNVKSIVLDTN